MNDGPYTCCTDGCEHKSMGFFCAVCGSLIPQDVSDELAAAYVDATTSRDEEEFIERTDILERIVEDISDWLADMIDDCREESLEPIVRRGRALPPMEVK